jgi:hypothetical protein
MAFEFVEHLEVDAMKVWVELAERHLNDSVYSFICSWIAFNYCYGTYCDCYHYGEQLQERSKIRKILDYDDFRTFFKEFMADNADAMPESLLKPIAGLRGEAPRHGLRVNPRNLEPETMFQILYGIRNDLFHGTKHPKTTRNKEVLDFAAGFMVPFVKQLLEILSNSKDGLKKSEMRAKVTPTVNG